jgi:hypothetical protein
VWCGAPGCFSAARCHRPPMIVVVMFPRVFISYVYVSHPVHRDANVAAAAVGCPPERHGLDDGGLCVAVCTAECVTSAAACFPMCRRCRSSERSVVAMQECTTAMPATHTCSLHGDTIDAHVAVVSSDVAAGDTAARERVFQAQAWDGGAAQEGALDAGGGDAAHFALMPRHRIVTCRVASCGGAARLTPRALFATWWSFFFRPRRLSTLAVCRCRRRMTSFGRPSRCTHRRTDLRARPW